MRKSPAIDAALEKIFAELDEVDDQIEEICAYIGEDVSVEMFVTDEGKAVDHVEWGFNIAQRAQEMGRMAFLCLVEKDHFWVVYASDEDYALTFFGKVLEYAHVLAVHAA